MFEVLIREAGARFGLGDKAAPLAQMLLASMTRKETGGLPGFLDKFKAAGLGPVVQSWLGGGPSAQPIGNEQLESVLGGTGGLLGQMAARLGVATDNVTSAVGYLLPAVVGLLTPGGSLPATLPPVVGSMASAGNALLAQPVVAEPAASAAAGMTKWLPWAAVAVAALLGLAYCAKDRGTSADMAPATVQAPAESAAQTSVQDAASSGMTTASAAEGGATVDTASTDAASAAAPAIAASGEQPQSPAGEAAVVGHSDGAAMVEARTVQDKPALKVYFATGKTEVPAEFASKAGELLAYLQEKPDSRAVISGFNDPTGNAAANAELSKQRASAVQAALVALGVAQDRTELEKPVDTTDGASASNSELRRVEVTLRD